MLVPYQELVLYVPCFKIAFEELMLASIDIGYFSSNALQMLEQSLSEIYIPLISNVAFDQTDSRAETLKSDFLVMLQKFSSQVTHTSQLVLGKNRLQIPADIANLANNIVSSSISTSNLSTDGKNPFSANIDLYGNNGSGASNSGGVINIPLRNVDGMTLDSTVASKDELYVIVRYNGSPTPLTSLKIEKSA